MRLGADGCRGWPRALSLEGGGIEIPGDGRGHSLDEVIGIGPIVC